MLLCIDVGNTNIKLGLFAGQEMRSRWRIATDRSRLADEYAMLLINLLGSEGYRLEQVTGCAISSVVPALAQVFGELSQRYLGREALVLGRDTLTGMRVNTDNPAEVGSDLIVNALAARHLYGAPVIVVGFGTATSFVAVSAGGNLEGVAIAPGIVTSGESLFRTTATLPQVALQRPEAAIGKNTVASLQAGMVYGFAGLATGVVQRIQAELGGGAKVVSTGGLAPLIAPEAPVIDAVEPDLGLIGLRLLYELNRAPASGS
jgi:type III pantothenate kinase